MSRGRGAQLLTEAGVIIASILVAFAIDATWDARQERQHEEQILAAVLEDMRANLGELERVEQALADSELVVEYFLGASPAALAAVSTDSATTAISVLLTGVATFGAYDGSLSGSNLSFVSDLALRNDLGAWLGQAADVLEDGPYLREGVDRLTRNPSAGTALRAIFDVGPDDRVGPELGEALAGLRADTDFVDEVLRQTVTRGINAGKLERLRETTERILARLEETVP